MEVFLEVIANVQKVTPMLLATMTKLLGCVEDIPIGFLKINIVAKSREIDIVVIRVLRCTRVLMAKRRGIPSSRPYRDAKAGEDRGDSIV